MSLGQAVAAGGLLGDVFIHTLPHAKDVEVCGLWILGGFTLFLVADLLIRSLEERRHVGKEDDNNNNHAHHSHSSASSSQQTSSLSLVILNMTADALHNFTDGLAIGASYAAVSSMKAHDSFLSMFTSRGGLASLSILLHEVPHELGDYCTLIRAGYSKSQAIRAQFFTAIAAFMGTTVALFVVGATAPEEQQHPGHHIQHDDRSQYLLLVTAGGFLYMAATTILPEVLHERGSLLFRMTQVLAFVAGILLLYFVALLEEEDDGHHHHPHGHTHHYETHTHSETHMHSHSEL